MNHVDKIELSEELVKYRQTNKMSDRLFEMIDQLIDMIIWKYTGKQNYDTRDTLIDYQGIKQQTWLHVLTIIPKLKDNQMHTAWSYLYRCISHEVIWRSKQACKRNHYEVKLVDLVSDEGDEVGLLDQLTFNESEVELDDDLPQLDKDALVEQLERFVRGLKPKGTVRPRKMAGALIDLLKCHSYEEVGEMIGESVKHKGVSQRNKLIRLLCRRCGWDPQSIHVLQEVYDQMIDGILHE
jgi:DNA-directed RNA polymerase specialized sigma24 family protein